MRARAVTIMLMAITGWGAEVASAQVLVQPPAPSPPAAPVVPVPPTPPDVPPVPAPPEPPPSPLVTGGAGYGDPPNLSARLTVPGKVARLAADGFARAPALAPPAVQEAVWAANELLGKPYRLGGGHVLAAQDTGYDCSGTVSHALRAGGFIKKPMDSSRFMRWAAPGKGRWITVYTNPGHAYVVIAGLRLDTSAAGDPSGAAGPRWRPPLRDSKRYKRRHPIGF